MNAKEVMEKYRIHRQTLCNWVKRGDIKVERLPNGRYFYHDPYESPVSTEPRLNIAYARVSSSGQKSDLESQLQRIKQFMLSRGDEVHLALSEVASALNYSRVKYRKLYDLVQDGKVEKIYIEHADRLLRIGIEDFKAICDKHDTKLIIMDNTFNTDAHTEIVNDMISIIHHYAAKLYSRRRLHKITQALIEVDE